MDIVFRLQGLWSSFYFNSIFIVYIAGKSLFILKNKALHVKALFLFFFLSLYPKIFLLSCTKTGIFWKFIALMNGLLASEEFL